MVSRSLRLAAGAAALMVFWGVDALAQQTLRPGVVYQEYSAPGPNNVFVVRVDRDIPEVELSMGFPARRRGYTARETVPVIASRYDQPPVFDVVAAINAGFFGGTNDIVGTLGSNGNLLAMPDLSRAWPEIVYTDAGDFLVFNDTTLTDNQVRFADGSSLGIDLINEDRFADSLIVYTPEWGLTTTTTSTGTEVIVHNVNYPLRPNKEMTGTVASVRTGTASINNAIPTGGLVLAARDNKGTVLAQKAIAGEPVRFRIGLSNAPLNNQFLMSDGAGWILRNGLANSSEWNNYSSSFTGRNPRTVIAWNSGEYFLVVIDGRSTESVGMSFSEMATFLSGTLGATDAVNLDGGGSSTMVVNGVIENVPSDGTPRAVGNAILLVDRKEQVFERLDRFPPDGRQLPWNERTRFNPVVEFAPPAPGGDGFVLSLRPLTTGTETAHVGRRWHRDYTVQAHVYFEHRPEITGGEVYGIYARDPGKNDFAGSGSDNYVLAYSSRDGVIRAGRHVSGAFTSMIGEVVMITDPGWHLLRIDCVGNRVRFLIDGRLIGAVTDTNHPTGYAGVGYTSAGLATDGISPARIDNFYHGPVIEDPEAWLLR